MIHTGKCALLVAVLFLSTPMLPAVTSTPTTRTSGDCTPVFDFIFGDNHWIIRINVTFEYDPGFVLEIQYRSSGSWVPYTGLFTIKNESDLYPFQWRYTTTQSGGQWIYNQTMLPPVKIDWTPPTATVSIEQQGILTKKRIITANANDAISGINRVEFYCNGSLQFTDTEAPYQYVISPVPHCTVNYQVRVYDNAGNRNITNITKPGIHPYTLPGSPLAGHPLLFLLNICRELRKLL